MLTFNHGRRFRNSHLPVLSSASNFLRGTNVMLQQPFDRSLNTEIFYNRGDGKIIMVDGVNAKYGAMFLGDTK
jgi:hypothetical protein